MQTLKSPFDWKKSEFAYTCLTLDRRKVSDEIMRYFGRPTDRTVGEKEKPNLAHRNALRHFRNNQLFSSAISAGLIWGPSLPMESRNAPGRRKAQHRKGGEVDITWGRTQLWHNLQNKHCISCQHWVLYYPKESFKFCGTVGTKGGSYQQSAARFK